MTFIESEQSTRGSVPVELYAFVGTYNSHFLTSSSAPVTYDGQTYIPALGLKRKEVSFPSSLDKNKTLSVEVAASEPIAATFAFTPMAPDLTLSVVRYQVLSGEASVLWTGKVSNVAVKQDKVSFVVKSLLSSLQTGDVPDFYMQAPCNHTLFDERCKVDEATNTLNTTVASVSTRTLVLTTRGSFADGWFVGGKLLLPTSGEVRSILAQDDLTLTLNYAFSIDIAGLPIEISAGCDRSFTGVNGCTKFNNKVNFGGFPFLPGESNNLFSKGL